MDQRPLLEEIFPGKTEMARRMRDVDWSTTALGPIADWPQSLRTSVSTCLDCAFPIVLWWGPDLTILYNDEYRHALGPKHPSALGQPGAQVWAEIWDVIEPMLRQVMERGEATRSRDLLLHIDRGYAEEAYFSFSYSPIRGEGGRVGGVFCPVIETTQKVIGERRLRTLRDLAAKCKGIASEEAAYAAAADVLAANPRDVPFALIYGVDHDTHIATLKAAIGIDRALPASPERLALNDANAAPWPLTDVVRGGRTIEIRDLAVRFDRLPTGAWKIPPHDALAVPVFLPGHDHPRAVIVAAVSPMRALDPDYRTFYNLIGTQLAAALADARALEDERRRAEMLAELDRAKTTFFSNVSHEFRTPLSLMIGPLEDLLADTDLNQTTRQSLRLAHRNSLRLLKLVNTLLDFSRIEAGRIDASYEPTDLAELTAELASVFRSAFEKAELDLVVACDPLPEPVYVDRDMWEKIVLNLLSNAFKFTFDGAVTVSLRWHGDHVLLEVADTGVGIPEADLPLMFERFHRVKHAQARTHEGTGIGLALVQELAKQHGGTVSVRSVLGRGSTFSVAVKTGLAHLPPERVVAPRHLVATTLGATPFVEEALRWLPDPEGTAAARPLSMGDLTTTPPVEMRAGTRRRVLLADDNADMRDYVSRLLGQSYDVTTVPDGIAALEAMADAMPDLIVSDVMMPRLDGFGLLEAVRKDERGRTLPVILLSARAGEEARIEGLRAGADDYLVKPFSARDLLARVASQLQLAELRRDAERAIRCRSEQYETLLNQAPIGVFVVDADFRLREMNPVTRPAFGDPSGGLVGRDFDEVIHRLWSKDYADEIGRIFRHTLETGEPYFTPERAEFRIDRGAIEYYEWRLDRITLPDGRYGLVCYFRDISAQVEARQRIADSEARLREADRRKDEFLALLSHELRNPLAPLRAGLELLRLQADAPDALERLRPMMERQVNQMVRLVDDLLDISRITSGKIVLQRAPTPLAEVIHAAIESQRAAIDERSIELIVSLPDLNRCIVNVDSVRVIQVLSNVLHNAVKFTPGGGCIRVSAAMLPGVGGLAPEAVVWVEDNGIGIPAELLPRIFDLFAQGSPEIGTTRGGLGIGLALARQLMEMHGGSIEAISAGPGQGSTFIMRVPQCQAIVTASPAPAAPAVPGRRVVIIDDNEDAADSLSLLVQMFGGDARTANSAPAGLAAIASFAPEIVLLDIGMPGMDGYETCRRIRCGGRADDIVVVALTGFGHAQDKQRAIEAGFDAHLTKPVDAAAIQGLLAAGRPWTPKAGRLPASPR